MINKGNEMNRQGFAMIEVIVSAMIMALLLGGLISAGAVAADQLRVSRTNMLVWEASTQQMEKLMAQDYSTVVSGSDTVQGFNVAWTVTGTNPKEIVLVIDRPTLRGQIRPDSFVTYLAEEM